MDRNAAADLLSRLHQQQSTFYTGGGDADLRLLLTDGIAWHVPGSSPIAGHYHGIDEVIGYFTHRRDLANSTMRMHPRTTRRRRQPDRVSDRRHRHHQTAEPFLVHARALPRC